MKKIFLAVVMLLAMGISASFAQHKASRNKSDGIDNPEESLRKAVEKNPSNLAAHQAYIKFMGLQNPLLEKYYKDLMIKFPKSAFIPFAIGKAFSMRELPNSRFYLLKAVELDPKLGEAWFELSFESSLRGDEQAARTYLQKAMNTNPSNADFALSYANSYLGVDDTKYKNLSLDVVKKFPKDEAAAKAMFLLGMESTDTAEKIKYFQILRENYDPRKYDISTYGMYLYYDLLLPAKPLQALELAEFMLKNGVENKEEWQSFVTQSKLVRNAFIAMEQKNAKKAMEELSMVKVTSGSQLEIDMAILKAKAGGMAGHVETSYQTLIELFAKRPSVKLHNQINAFASKLQKDGKSMKDDIWAYIDKIAKPATSFKLRQYTDTARRSIEDYRGRVLLLTYWFPGCGPCRAEFPHFEKVVRKFNSKDLGYVGINIVSAQNEYVLPFLKKTGYSFTALEDEMGRVKGNLDNRRAAPMNFLIDQQGRLIFSDFSTDAASEQDLVLMINLLLQK